MTEVRFHFNVPDRLGYTCRLLRKALRAASKVAVTGAPPLLGELDRQLWVFEPNEFVPHLRLLADQRPTPAHRHTPVWLVDDATAALHLPVLVNLGHEPPRGFESYERLIEVVSHDAGDREAARRRWKHYAARGYAVASHEVAA